MDTSDFRNGISILMDNDIYTITDFQHVKPGKGGAFVRSTLKNIKNGRTIDKTWRAGERMEQAILERRPMQYLYNDGTEYYVMDPESFEQISIRKEQIGEGEAVFQDSRMSSAEALKRAGVQPLTLEAKEAISLINGTQGMLAVGTLALLAAENLAATADVLSAMSLDMFAVLFGGAVSMLPAFISDVYDVHIHTSEC